MDSYYNRDRNNLNKRSPERSNHKGNAIEDESEKGKKQRKLVTDIQSGSTLSIHLPPDRQTKRPKGIQEIMQRPNVFAIIGERHGEISPQMERDYWAEKGVKIYYEGDLLSLTIEGEEFKDFFDDKYLKSIHSAELIQDELDYILDYPDKKEIPYLVLESKLIPKLRNNVESGLENILGLNNMRQQEAAPARYSDEQIDVVKQIKRALTNVIGSSQSVTNEKSRFYGQTEAVLEEIKAFKDVLKTGYKYVPIPDLNLIDNRSIHMMVMAEEYAKKSSGRTIYKIGDNHISDMLFRNDNKSRLSPDIPGTKVVLMNREKYLQETNLA